jgi:hypothetical protein
MLLILDAITQMFFGFEIVITSAYRPKGKNKSFHPKWQAVDFRTKGLPPLIVTVWGMVVTLVNKIAQSFTDFEGRFDFVYEPRKVVNGKVVREEHAHLELDTGDPI